jgi:hypothetical protein
MTGKVAILTCASGLLLLGADPWKDKKPADWSAKEVNRIRTNSPWAKSTTTGANMDAMSGMRGRGAGDPGGLGGGGVSGREAGPGGVPGQDTARPGGGLGGPGGAPIGGGPVASTETTRVTVRWESAAPVREAAAKVEDPNAGQFNEWSQTYYVISASGLPNQMLQLQDKLKQATLLKRKGKGPIAPEQVGVLKGTEGPVMVFLFPRSDAINPEDKEVSFESVLGPMEVKSKFGLKDMVYEGKLAL